MTKSTITRDELNEVIATYGKHHIAHRMANVLLAAIASEPVEMPLDYLQGHKDGLEWAAQLAEANHPETGDWLYDDRIELAKAILKGPDMPPAQPEADSEPVALHMGEAINVFNALKVEQLSERVNNAGLGPMGASNVQVWTSKAGGRLEFISTNGGCTLNIFPQPAPLVLDAVDTNLIEALRLVQCMLDDYRERNYGDAQGWIRHINTHMSDYTEAHGDDAYSVLHNLITAAPQEVKS
jgi:hypothetical protein